MPIYLEKSLFNKCAIALAFSLLSVPLAAQQKFDTYLLIDHSDTDATASDQQAFNLSLQPGQSLRTSSQEAGFLILRDDTTLTLAPGTEITINSIDSDLSGEVQQLDAGLFSGSVRFDLASVGSMITFAAGEKMIMLSQGSGVDRLNDDGTIV